MLGVVRSGAVHEGMVHGGGMEWSDGVMGYTVAAIGRGLGCFVCWTRGGEVCGGLAVVLGI